MSAPLGSWQREGGDLVYRTAAGGERYREPLARLNNSWDVLDLLGHLAKKPAVTDADLGNLVRLLEALYEFATCFPRGCKSFDALERIAELHRRRERQSA